MTTISEAAGGELRSDLVDVTGLSLDDVLALPDTALAVALRHAMLDEGGETSAGFSSRLPASD